jgi:hypothetical protein
MRNWKRYASYAGVDDGDGIRQFQDEVATNIRARVEERGDGYMVLQERGTSKDEHSPGVRCHSVDDLQDLKGVCRSLERGRGICMYQLRIYLCLLFKALCQTLQCDETPMKV